MKTLNTLFARFTTLKSDQRGAVSVEYIILAGVVALTIIGGFSSFGQQVNNKIQEQAGRVSEIPGK